MSEKRFYWERKGKLKVCLYKDRAFLCVYDFAISTL